jgi:hypothetical protein
MISLSFLRFGKFSLINLFPRKTFLSCLFALEISAKIYRATTDNFSNFGFCLFNAHDRHTIITCGDLTALDCD